MYLLLDESGDLGWKLDLPRGNGGSSQYFTIAHFCCFKHRCHIIERFIKRIHEKFKLNPAIEKKGCNFSDVDALKICIEISQFLKKHEEVRLGTITLKKSNVKPHLRLDENILYNYATYKSIYRLIAPFNNLHFIQDKRSIKVRNADVMVGYLHTKLRTEHDSNIKINFDPQISSQYKDLWFVDWIANFVWRHYEQGRSDAYNELIKSDHFHNKKLYFD